MPHARAFVFPRCRRGRGGGSHIGKGLSWYIGPVLHDLLRRESDLWVVRAETCERDMEGAIRWLRGDDTLDDGHRAAGYVAWGVQILIITQTEKRRRPLTARPRKKLQRCHHGGRVPDRSEIGLIMLDASVNYGAKRRRGSRRSSSSTAEARLPVARRPRAELIA